MGHTCVVHGCKNRASNELTVKQRYFAIPVVREHQGEQTKELSERRRNAWLARINRKDFTPSKYSKICSDHFIEGKPADLYSTTHPDWAPSLKLAAADVIAKSSTTSKGISFNRYKRMQDRKGKQQQYDAASSLLSLSSVASEAEDNVPCEIEDTPTDAQVEPERCTRDPSLCASTSAECQRLLTANLELKEKINGLKITIDSFKNDDKKVNYYTGLPSFSTLMAVFEHVEAYIPESTRTDFTKFQKFISVLMKLRHNLPVNDLAYRFGVSQATISRTFISLIHVLYIRLKNFIHWPDRENLRLSMPLEFRKHFGLKVCIIIDCFEVFIERPSNLKARCQTWSSYKHHNTVKFLIGVTPQGSVSFLSKAWGGRASDKHITENSSLLENLLPGDLVLADRGFDISESVGLMCAEVKIPGFTRGKSQLAALEIERTRNIAHVRIHVERVIGLVRNKYTILSGTLPLDYMISSGSDVPTVDKIATVCCALSNFCGSVVPFN